MPSSNEELADQLVQAGSRIEPLLRELFPPEDQDYLSTPFWHHMRTGGKKVRPALCLLCCEEMGGDPEKALHFAAAVEILHNMLLVHDDLEDGDRVRRDAPTVWVEFGVENAVNLGDYMLGRAYTTIQDSPLPGEAILRLLQAFTRAFEHTCQGQALDLNRRGDADLTVEQYLEMVRRKTGDYLALGMVGGAIVAGISPEGVDSIRELGGNMGPAFQVRDDVIDLTQGKGRGGALGNDIKEGKPSILYAHALSEAQEEDRNRLLEIIRESREQTSDEDVEWTISLYERVGSLNFARRTADSLVEEAFQTIERIPVENKGFFRRIARFMAERTT
jgi:geranylgeranyl pyrophosphate synthase